MVKMYSQHFLVLIACFQLFELQALLTQFLHLSFSFTPCEKTESSTSGQQRFLTLHREIKYTSWIEHVSMECRKTKTKVITLANQKEGCNPVNQSKIEVITRSGHKARENLHARATIGFGFTVLLIG